MLKNGIRKTGFTQIIMKSTHSYELNVKFFYEFRFIIPSLLYFNYNILIEILKQIFDVSYQSFTEITFKY